MKKAKRLLSLLLIVVIITSLVPSTAFAAVDTSIVANDVVKNLNTTGFEEKKVSEIIGEVTEKRDANVKHFLKDDNSYEAVVYQEPVHYLEDGTWKAVDNSLAEASDASVIYEDGITLSQKSNNIVKNKANDYEVSFAMNANVNKLVNLQKR